MRKSAQTSVVATSLLPLILAATLAASGCGKVKSPFGKKDDGDPATAVAAPDPTDPSINTDPTDDPIAGNEPQPSPLQLAGAMQSFASCDAAKDHIATRLIAEMRRQIQQQIDSVERYGTDGGGYNKAAAPEAAADSAVSTAGETATADLPSEVTTTNNQVAGVEEADFVKNTGNYIFQVTRGKLRILKSWPADELSLLSETALDGRPFELLLDEAKNRLVVLSHPRRMMTAESKSGTDVGAPAADVGASSLEPGYYPTWDYERLEVTVLDVADAKKPRVVNRYHLKGAYNAARRIDASVRIVLQSFRPWPTDVVTWVDMGQVDATGQWVARTKDDVIAELKALVAKNEEIIKGKDLSWWLETDSFSKSDADGQDAPLLALGDCQNIHAPTVDTQFGLTRIASIDLDRAEATETVLLTYAGTIYASKDSLYVTTPYWWWSERDRDTDYTFVHKFDISEPGTSRYQGSGGVEGSLLNQFAMDEYDGDLRVATTVQRYCAGDSDVPVAVAADAGVEVAVASASAALQDAPTAVCPPPGERTYNQVSVLREDHGALAKIGATEPLAKGERIYSVRFQGPRGFMVTFRQVDPLFTLDLSDPEAPKAAGELKVPGYSSYIQMLDDARLLTIGRDGDALKLAIFDVGDMSKPRQLHTHSIDGAMWSEAEYNHLAFNLFKSKGLLAIPVSGYRYTGSPYSAYWWGQYESALRVFRVDAFDGISEVGKLDMTDIYQSSTKGEEGWWFSGATVQRSVFADDYVYAISDFGIKAAPVDALTAPVANVSYQCDKDCIDSWWWY